MALVIFTIVSGSASEQIYEFLLFALMLEDRRSSFIGILTSMQWEFADRHLRDGAFFAIEIIALSSAMVEAEVAIPRYEGVIEEI